ncbi:MAG TPA: DUF3616 domain-containing protein [Amycolatopsis sp.]|nr:DUF3616 domain-containing protein [Amycolatopsis sp.]
MAGFVAGMGRRRKVRSTPFREKNGRFPFNASGVVQVDPRRFVFIDNKDPTAFFEMTLDHHDGAVERIRRRPLAGLAPGMLGDPEGLTRADVRGETVLIASSSLCVTGRQVSDGLVRVRYVPEGDLPTEAMHGFRAWLLAHEPTLAAAGMREPDAGGLNIEGLAWDPRRSVLLFGLRGPATSGLITVVQVPVDAGAAAWTTEALGAPTVAHARTPRPRAEQGIRDISYDTHAGRFLLLLGRSTSNGKDPFQLCTWNGTSETVRALDTTFHRTAKPEGVTAFSAHGEQKLLLVDDSGGYAVLGAPGQEKNSFDGLES